MGRKRYISTDISKDPRIRQLAERSEFAALLYTWMIPHAGDDATVSADPDELLMLVIPGFRWRSIDDVRDALELIVGFGLVERVGPRLRFPSSFYRYQAYIGSDRRAALPEDEDLRKSAQNGATKNFAQEPAQNSTSVSSSLTSPVTSPVSSPAVPAVARERAREARGPTDETAIRRKTDDDEDVPGSGAVAVAAYRGPPLPVCWMCAAIEDYSFDHTGAVMQGHKGPCELGLPPATSPVLQGANAP